MAAMKAPRSTQVALNLPVSKPSFPIDRGVPHMRALLHPRAGEFCDMAFLCTLMDDPVVAADGHTSDALPCLSRAAREYNVRGYM